jgi:predicted signal transduction protein with EAL and GGDEF domain
MLGQVSDRLRAMLKEYGEIDQNQHDGPWSRGVIEIGNMVVARLGGDEFAILLNNAQSVDQVTAVAARVANLLEPHFNVDGQAIAIGGSVGIALYPEHGHDSKTLVRRADVALYEAKKLQQPYALYNSSLDEDSLAQLTLRTELRRAIDTGGLQLYYQPKLDMRTSGIKGVEALLRWDHLDRGMIMPDQFIPIAEQRGLIVPLTHWVIKEALSQHSKWRDQGVELNIAINLSSRVLYDLELPAFIQAQLDHFGIDPTVMELEITEDATMADPGRALEILKNLNGMGIRLAIDDFGTGYSSLGYLKNLPVEKIKIDKSFVLEMSGSESDAKIVHATIDLAHNLGLKVVAEGVEDPAVLDMLHGLHCDIAQGYCIGRPMPPDKVLEWLEKVPWEAMGKKRVS